MPSDRTQQARERAAEIIEAFEEQDITWHSQGPWEHLGDACRDGRLMADDVLFLAARVSTLETALREQAQENERLAERIDYLLRTDPAEWEPEVIRWLSPTAVDGRE